MNFEQALATGSEPLKGFMLSHTRAADLELFTRMARLEDKGQKLGSPNELPLRVVIPAFVTSELKTAFQIGFMVFIPFLIIDMVVASVLMSMGMMMMSPMLVSAPFKILLFVLVDGWVLVVGTLAGSFNPAVVGTAATAVGAG
jgi:flagellar biosynthetic protein FliP